MKSNHYEINILIGGRPIQEYQHDLKTFIEGRSGSEFEIEIINRSASRIEAVVSVDGLSITDGKPAGLESSGYLVNALDRLVIPGWKVDGATAARFFFAGKDKSYSTEMTGSSINNGVIGMLVFEEKVYRRDAMYLGSPLRASSAGSPRGFAKGMNSIQCSANMSVGSAATASASVNNLGTGFGQAEEFRTTKVNFERGNMGAQVVMYYDSAKGLRARGIELGRVSRPVTQTEPSAFPAMSDGCQPPKGWSSV